MRCACAILSSVACQALQYFSTLPHKGKDFRKRVIENKMCFYFLLNISDSQKNWSRKDKKCVLVFMYSSGVTRGVWGVKPPWNSKGPPKSPNSTRLWKLLKIAEFRMPTPQDVRQKGSKVLKLPPVRNCFTLAMTNKLVVIINSLKIPKIKKILLYEMKFLVPNYSCFQNPWLGGYRPQIPVLSVLNRIYWTPN